MASKIPDALFLSFSDVFRVVPFQDKVFNTPTILLSGSVSGEEEIPSGVQAVLVRSAAESPDILSHVSVRARNAHVLLGVCFDPAIAQDLVSLLKAMLVKLPKYLSDDLPLPHRLR